MWDSDHNIKESQTWSKQLILGAEENLLSAQIYN